MRGIKGFNHQNKRFYRPCMVQTPTKQTKRRISKMSEMRLGQREEGMKGEQVANMPILHE